MSKKWFSENIEYDSDCDSEYNSDSECESGSKAKKLKIDRISTIEGEDLETDENGHIICHPGRKLGNYEIISKLGEGAFGRVLLVTNCITNQEAALKVIKNEEKKRKAAMKEIIALTVISCRDKNNQSLCIKMFEWFSHNGHVCIAFPALGLSVYEFLKENSFEPFSIGEVRHISYQLCNAVSFLHKHGFTHTDLKPENMLFVSSSFTTMVDDENKVEIRRLKFTDIRLIDFGNVSRDGDIHSSVVSTRYYRAPEVILKLGWSYPCDVWSIGCILAELYTGILLFPSEEDLEHLGMMEKTLGQIPLSIANTTKTSYFKNGILDFDWDKAEEDAKEHCRPIREFMECEDEDEDVNNLFNVIERMLEYEPTERLTVKEALVQPFFEKIPSHQRIKKEVS